MTHPVPALDLSRLRRIHVVGVGGAGMSAIASVLAAMGHTSRAATSRRRPASSACGPAASGGRRPRRRQRLGERRRRRPSPPPSPTATRGARRPRAGHPRAPPGRGAGRHLRRAAARWPWPAPTARRRRRRCWPWCWPRRGCGPSFIIGGEVNEIGTGAVWDEGELVRRRGRRERRHVPRAAAPRRPSSPTSSPTTSSTTAASTGSAGRLRPVPGRAARPPGGVRRRPRGAAGRRPPPGLDVATVRHGRRTPTTACVDLDVARVGAPLRARAAGRARWAAVELPVPGAHNARNAAAAIVHRPGAGRPVRRRPGGPGPLRRRGPPVPVPGRGGRRHLRRRLRPPAHRGGRPPSAAGRAGGWRRVVCVFQPHRYSRTGALWPDFADAFVDADLLVVTDVYPAGEAPRPGVTGKLVVDAVLDAHPWSAGGLPAPPGRPRALPRRRAAPRRPVPDLGAGDLTTLPDELLPPPGVPGPPDDGGRQAAAATDAVDAPRRDRCAPTSRSARSPPTGWAAPAALFAGGRRRRPRPARWPARRVPAPAALVVGQGLEPAGGRRRLPAGWPWPRARPSPPSRWTGTGCGPAAPPPCRCWPGGSAPRA